MSSKDIVKYLLYKRGMTFVKLAEELTNHMGRKYTRTGISSKLRLGSLRFDEMEAIAKILDYEIKFEDLRK